MAWGVQNQKPARLLIVDDSPTNLKILEKTLENQGYELAFAKCGEQALEMAGKLDPTLILLDIIMPDIDGYEVCRRLKEDPATSHISIIFLTALSNTEDKVKGFEMGAVDYIIKPFQKPEIQARVRNHVHLHRLKQQLEEKNQQLEAANERMRADLKAAARMQVSLLPKQPPKNDSASFAWFYHPCEDLGGDAFNVFRLDDTHLGMYVIDVSGHGVSAALLSVSVLRSLTPHGEQSILRRNTGSGVQVESPSVVAERLNQMYPMSRNDMHFVALVYGVLDIETSIFRYVCAGHPGPVLCRPGQTPEAFDPPGFVIGMLENGDFRDHEVTLAPGDRLLLYSDGLIEERNQHDEEFGLKRLLESLDETRDLVLSAALNDLIGELGRFRGMGQSLDDITMVGLDYGKVADLAAFRQSEDVAAT